MDIRAVVAHYKVRHRSRATQELDSFRQEKTLADAVARAARASKPDGSRYSHQWRLKPEDLERAAKKLETRLAAIERAQNFGILWEAIRSAVSHLAGLGELYVYDTSLRIGAKKETLPARIYLHAGTRDGAKALGIDIKGRKVIDRFELPLALQDLQPHEIEDVLCIYKAHFTGERPDLDANEACWIDGDEDEEAALATLRCP